MRLAAQQVLVGVEIGIECAYVPPVTLLFVGLDARHPVGREIVGIQPMAVDCAGQHMLAEIGFTPFMALFQGFHQGFGIE